ncbi:MAG TPA: universal stress protein [Chloroflexota bacterium]|nr:universal stress protein [Chloroflexota bacterium]
MYKHLLVPLDGSKLAEDALPHAEAIARRFQSNITLFQVAPVVPIPPSVDPMTGTGNEAIVALEASETAELEARQYLKEVASRPILEGIAVTQEVTRGKAAREIVQRANKRDIDLIVMSTHGRSGLGRLVFGSVAEAVLRESGTPILLIHSHEK